MNRRFASGKAQLVGQGITYPVPIPLDPAAYVGALAVGLDPADNRRKLYFSDGQNWSQDIFTTEISETIERLIDDLILVGFDEAELPDPTDPANLRRYAFNNDRGVPGFVWDDEWRYLADEARVAEIATQEVEARIFTIRDDIVVNVPQDHPTIVDAMEELLPFRIAQDAKVDIIVDAGTYDHTGKVIPGHPDGTRIFITGPELPGGPIVVTDLVATGSGSSERAADKATNEAALRSRFPVVIECDGRAALVENSSLTLKNMLFVGDTSQNGIETQDGQISLENVATVGFGRGFRVSRDGNIDANGCVAVGAVNSGFETLLSGTLRNQNGFSYGNADNGYFVNGGGTLSVAGSRSLGNANNGYFTSVNGFMQAPNSNAVENGRHGYFATMNGAIQAPNSTSVNNVEYGYYALNMAKINAKDAVSTGNSAAIFPFLNHFAAEFGVINALGAGGIDYEAQAVNAFNQDFGLILADPED